MQSDRLLIGAVLFLTALAYLNSLSGQFLYDDWYQIERNPAIKSWSFLSSVFSHHVWEFANTENLPVSGEYYRPIFNLALLINYQLFGLKVAGWHIVSLLFHLGATALVYQLGRLWNFEKIVAALAALIFGLHPIHVEVVSWASALPDLMLGFFVLSCLVLYEKSRRSQVFSGWYFAGSVICALLAAGTKETGIVLPLFLMVREAFDQAATGDASAKLRGSVIKIGAFAAVAFAYLSARYAVLGFITKTNVLAEKHSVGELILTIPFIVIRYLKTLMVPHPLAYIYDYEFVSSASDVRFWGAAILLTAMIALIIRYSMSRPDTVKALALFAVFLLPALNLRALAPIESIAHDRYLYLPSAGFFLYAAFGLDLLARRFGRHREALLIGLGAVAAPVLGAMTLFQNQIWRNDVVLTEHALRLAPNWPFLHLRLAEIYEGNGRLAEAEDEWKRVVGLAPDWASGHAMLGNLYSKQGRWQEAERALEEAMRRGSAAISTRVNLAVNQIKVGKLSEAKEILERVLAEHPENSAANYNLGLAYEREAKLELAEQHYQRAIFADPTYIDARVNLTAVLLRQNRLDQAFEQIRVVRSLAPENSEIQFSLAAAYLQSQQCSLAVDSLNQLSKAQPNQPRVYVMLGLSYECLGQLENARSSFARAIEVAPQDPINEVARRHLEQLSPK